MQLSDWRQHAVHPTIRAFPALAARHWSFIAVHGATGIAALASVAAYLWATGWPTPGEFALALWLLSPLAAALALRASGALERVETLWLVNLTALVTTVALVTGGFASFVLPWFLVIPTEAALTGERRTWAEAALFTLAGLAVVLTLGGAPRPPIDPAWVAFGLASALLYIGAIARAARRVHSRSEAALRDGKADYRFLADNALDVITRHSPNGRILFASPACATLFGLAPEDLAGHDLDEFVHPHDRVALRTAFDRARYFNDDATVEYRVRTVTGHTVWVETRCRCVESIAAVRRTPRPLLPSVEIVCVTRDIAERKSHEDTLVRAREDADAANAAKSRFLANMSHELRTPLNAVLGFSEMIEAQTFGPVGSSKYREYAELIHSSGRHLLNLINDVLDMSKVEAGKFDIAPEEIAVAALVEDALKLVAVTAQKAGVRLVAAVPKTLPPLVADRRAVRQILLNLLSNALKFTPRGGTVTVEAATGSGVMALAVTDSGVGIAAGDLDRLGRPYEQARDPMIKAKTGTGLGLALVRALADLHGGSLRIESEVGVGTRVCVILPLAQTQASRQPIELRGAA